MRFQKACISSIGYELGPVVVTSDALEARIAPVYKSLGLPLGQLQGLTGIRERRWWDPGFELSEGAARAGRDALSKAGMTSADLDAVVYASVCREHSEPATACAVADKLGVGPKTLVYDIGNACLGVINGILDLANRIELGQIRAGMVVACESAREINDSMAAALLARPKDFEYFRLSVATFTGGSGAAAVIVTDASIGRASHRLLGGTARSESKHHKLCIWHRDHMSTDASAVMKHGVALGAQTWADLMSELNWTPQTLDKTVCHQVGAPHRAAVLKAIGVSPEKDFSCFEFLGNMGTVALPVAAALAEEREFLLPGDKAAFLGIGSGLNCLMLGVQW
ncbi:MAG: 3-oxoacyl-ACP synthase III [Elusimicrobia bacterium]|nr:3-oxoacyl-ACP synthase III [Elusimicrobiota bacterium]